MEGVPEIEGYDIQETLGDGPTGSVYRGCAQGGGVACVVKIFRDGAINAEFLIDSLEALVEHENHQGMIKMHGGGLVAPPYYLVTDFLPLSLETEREKLDADTAWRLLQELAEAVSHLHRHGLAHCNLTLGNVRLEDPGQAPVVKLGDMGIGWIAGVENFTLTDHPYYLSPEQMRDPEGQTPAVAARWDVYSFGVVCYRTLTGKYPRGGKHIAEYARLAQGATAGGARPAVTDFVSLIETEAAVTWPEALLDEALAPSRHVIERCLSLKAEERYRDMTEVASALVDSQRDGEVIELRKGAEKVIRSQRRSAVAAKTMAGACGILMGGAGVGSWFLWQDLEETREDLDKVATVHQGELDELIGLHQKDVEQMHSVLAVIQAERDVSRSALASARGFAESVSSKGLQDGTASRETAKLAAEYYEGVLETEEAADQRYLALTKLVQTDRILGRDKEMAIHLADTAELLSQGSVAFEGGRADVVQKLLRIELARAELFLKTADNDQALTLSRSLVDGLQPTENYIVPDNVRLLVGRALLVQGRALHRSGDGEAALKAFLRAGTVVAPAGAETGDGEGVVVAVAARERAVLLRETGKIKKSTELAAASAEKLIALTDKSPGAHRLRYELSLSYVELGRCLGESGSQRDASRSFTEGINILTDLVKEVPSSEEYRFQLALSYSSIAGLVRDAGESETALKYQDGAITFLGDIAKGRPGASNYRLLLIQEELRKAKLLKDLGRKVQELALLEKTAQRFGEETGIGQSDWQRARAEIFGALSLACEGAKKTAAAAAASEESVGAWETLAELLPGDATVQKELEKELNRLRKIKG